MPPKSAAPAKSVKSSILSTKGNNKKDKFPVSQVDYTQPLILKNSKVSFGEKLVQVKVEHKERIEDLIMELDLVKRENERLRRQQEDTFGVTADSVDRMKKELERAKTTRMFLLEDIEVRKGKSEKMEADIFELNMKLESFNKKLNEYNQMRDEWMNTSEKLQKTEEKCEKLTKVNRNLRLLLLKHHIDPKSVEFDNGRSKKSAASDKGPVRSILKPSGLKRKPDAHTQSHNNTITGHPPRGTRSLGDNRQDPAEVVDEEVKRRTSFTSRKALGRGPPSYLGYYTDIHHSRVMGKAKVDTVHLPKLVVA